MINSATLMGPGALGSHPEADAGAPGDGNRGGRVEGDAHPDAVCEAGADRGCPASQRAVRPGPLTGQKALKIRVNEAISSHKKTSGFCRGRSAGNRAGRSWCFMFGSVRWRFQIGTIAPSSVRPGSIPLVQRVFELTGVDAIRKQNSVVSEEVCAPDLAPHVTPLGPSPSPWG